MDLKFKCPRCGGDVIVQEVINSTVFVETTIDAITGDVSWHNSEFVGGDNWNFHCRDCDYILRDGSEPITTDEELLTWLLRLPENEQFRQQWEDELDGTDI